MLPARSLNGVRVGGGPLPGPVTMRLIRAWNDMVGLDFVAQALAHLGDNEKSGALAEAGRGSGIVAGTGWAARKDGRLAGRVIYLD